MRYLFFLLSFIVFKAFSQDSLVYFNELEFKNEIEKASYTRVYKGDEDLFFDAFFTGSEDNAKVAEY